MKIKNHTIGRLLSLAMLIVAVCFVVTFSNGCTPESPPLDPPSGTPEATPTGTEQAATPTEQATPTEDPTPTPVPNDGKTVVVVFSQTGNTKRVAEIIARYAAEYPGAELYVIEPEIPYTSDDINWNDKESRTTKEQNDASARPAIGSEKIDLTGCTRLFLGYPIWFGKEPRIMDTFVESYDFTGITVIPFCTSGSSGIAQSKANLEKLAGSGHWESGKRFAGTATENEIFHWLKENNYLAVTWTY